VLTRTCDQRPRKKITQKDGLVPRIVTELGIVPFTHARVENLIMHTLEISEASLRGKFVALKIYTGKKEKSHTNDFNFQLK
jgi:hypothetical protein